MRNFLKGLAGLAALILVAGLPVANATVVTTGSAAFDVTATCTNLVGCNGGTPTSTLSSELIFSNFTFTPVGSTVTFTTQIEALNTTTQGSLTASQFASVRLTSFGFNTTPDATGGSDNSAVFDTFLFTNFPGFNTVDVCEGAGPTCPGGGNGGLTPGQTDTFTLTLTGLPGGTTSLDLGTNILGGAETFDFKIQSDFGSFEFAGTPNSCPPGTPGCVVNPPTNVPEPTSLALFGTAMIAFGGLMAWRRRRHSSQGVGYAAA